MAVTRLSAATASITNAAPHTIAAGSNRVLLVGVAQEQSSPVTMTMSYGGESMTKIVTANVGDATDQQIDIFWLDETGIAAAADNQIDITSTLPGAFHIHAQAYEGADQTAPTVFDSEGLTGDSDPLANIQISAVADEAVFGMGGSGNTSTGVTWAGTNPLIALNNENAGTSHGASADRLVTGTETVNHNLTFTTAPNRVAGAAVLIESGVTSHTSSGTPSIVKPTSSGNAEIEKQASGTPSIVKPTSSGTADRFKPASGSPSITKPTSAGTAIGTFLASGSPSITKPTSTGTIVVTNIASGSPSIARPTSSGAAERELPAVGSPSITQPTSTGVSEIKKIASGSPSITKPVSNSGGDVPSTKNAGGSPSITKPTSTGVLLLNVQLTLCRIRVVPAENRTVNIPCQEVGT